MAEFEITGIRKDNGNHHNPNEAISHYRWFQDSTQKGGITERPQVVSWVKTGINAYVERVRPRAYVTVKKSSSGLEFLQTNSDSTEENNLLQLPPV
jgi:hypothetical protein